MDDYQKFLAIKDDLTASLASSIYKTLKDIGPDIQGISWFSSNARAYNESKGYVYDDTFDGI